MLTCCFSWSDQIWKQFPWNFFCSKKLKTFLDFNGKNICSNNFKQFSSSHQKLLLAFPTLKLPNSNIYKKIKHANYSSKTIFRCCKHFLRALFYYFCGRFSEVKHRKQHFFQFNFSHNLNLCSNHESADEREEKL